MSVWSRLNSIVAAFLLLCGAAPFSLAQVIDQAPPRNRSRELIVKLKPQASPSERQRALRNATETRQISRGLTRQGLRAQEASSTLVLTVRDDVPVGSEIARLGSSPAVEYVEPNYPLKLLDTEPVIPNDFEFSKMYALLNTGAGDAKTNSDIHATEAWRYTTGDKRVIVAVIDTGIDYLHEDLRDNIWVNEKEIPFNGIDDDGNGVVDDYMGYDFVSNDSDPFDDNEHGTHVAGIIGAKGNNEIGTVGVCWNVSLMALKAFDEQGNGTVDDAISAIEYAVQNGARIINASWGLDERSRALEEAVQRASDAGVLFVAAAGNNRTDAPSYPAFFDSVLSVGATDNKDARAIFSNYGATVDAAAPGDNIFSTLPENSYGFLSGTSMAAPHVSGIAALVLSRFPNYSRQELFDILINSVDVVTFDQPMGNGRINAGRAVQMDEPLPTARLIVPATVSGSIALSGTANGSFTTGYGVFIGPGKTPTNWLAVASSTARVTNSFLAQLDTAMVPDGAAVVQLVVTNSNGATATVNAPCKVLNALISSPLSTDILAPAKLEIRGTLYGANKRFELSYGAGLSPTKWTPIPSVEGQTILDGTLGEWDTTTLPTGPYSLRMVSFSDTNRSEFLAPMIYIDRHLRDGWPVSLPTDDDFPPAEWRNVRVADLDGDGKAEFVVVEPGTRNRQQVLNVFSIDGQLLWSRDLGYDIPPDVPAIGDVDGDGKPEIFVDVSDGVTAFHHDGSPVAGWPVKKSTRNQAKVLADLNRDGVVKLITYSQEYSATQVPDLRELAIYNGKGNLIKQWNLPWCGSTNDVQKIFPAVANIDDDPQLEIIVVSGCSEIAAFDYRQDEPKWRATGEGVFLSSPVIGDVDGDGFPEIVAAAAAENGSETGGVYVFRGNGERWRGWPVLEEYSFTASPALGDLDHDGRLEIVLASTRPSGLHVLQWDGFEADGWPIDAFHYGSSRVGVALADIDGDGTSEILSAMPGFTLLALSQNDADYVGGVIARNLAGAIVPLNGASAIRGFPFENFTPYRTHKASPPLLGDFDGDGSLDMSLASLQDRTFGTNLKLKKRSSLYNWQLGVPLSARTLEWPMFAHDVQNRGAYTLPPYIVPNSTNTTRAVRDRVLGLEDRPLEIQPLLNDVGVAPLQITSFAQPDHGAVTRTSATTLLYTPEKDFSGLDEFSYTIQDAQRGSSSAKVIIRIKPFNDSPTAEDIHLTVKKNSSVTIFYNGTDSEDDKLTFRVTDTPASGELWNYPALGVYYPKRGFFGTDSFHYVANDGNHDSAPAAVTIDVINSNNPPTLVSQTFLTKTNRSLRIDPSASDLDGDPITFELASPPQHGTTTAEEAGFRYAPNKDYLGDDSFTVRPFDGSAHGDPATMTISVIATNATPVASNGSATVAPNTPLSLSLPGRDPDGDQIAFTILTQPLHGTLTGAPPKLTYTPATNFLGPDKFTYKVSDGFAESQPATYSIQVVRRNRPPEAADQTILTTVGERVSFGLNVTDPDEDPMRTVILRGPANGLLFGSGTNFTYVPNVGSLGSDSFTYKAWDGQKFGKVARVTLLVSLPREQLPPSFRSVKQNGDVIELMLEVPNTNAFYLEISSNLIDWTNRAGRFISPQESFSYKETNSADTVRFYRARRGN
jgi:subtilisin family serine protease